MTVPTLQPNPDEYVPTPEELVGESYGYCYMTPSVIVPEEPKERHDHQ